MSQKFYITTSIPYVNGKAHIGHALEFTQADVLARWHRELGDEVAFVTGADEHGSKIYKTATEQKRDPQSFVDEVTESFKQVHKILNISYDGFVRTSSEVHKQAAQAVWQKLLDKGDIYKGEYEGLYCVGCESFVTEEHARQNNGVCPNHQKPYEKLKEENYFFKLAQYTGPVKTAIEQGEFSVKPLNRQHEILQVLDEGLEDISVSRPQNNLPWGVPVPNDTDQVMYVWFEALINYISAIGYPDNSDFQKFWPADVHVIGKDILRFHAAIWPAMLLAIDEALPKTLFVHGFIGSGGQKMSKSIGNVVDPFVVVEQYNADAFRYYLLRHIPPADDGDFTFEKFERAYNGELANDLGNLVSRLASMIKRYQEGVIGAVPEPEHDIAEYNRAMANFEFSKALEAVWVQVRGLNQYLEEEKPWEVAKETDPEHLREIMSYAVGALIEIARLLSPFMPDTSKAILELFANGLINGEIPNLFPKQYHYTEQTRNG